MKLANSSLDICSASLRPTFSGGFVSPTAAAAAVSSSSLHKSASKVSRSGSTASVDHRTIITITHTHIHARMHTHTCMHAHTEYHIP